MSALLKVGVITGLLISCGGGKDSGNEPDAPPEMIEANSNSQSYLNQLDMAKYLFGKECRIDESDGKEYCLEPDEMPSDTDPEKKVKLCKSGILDNDICKPLTFVIEKDVRKIFAGTPDNKTLRGIAGLTETGEEYTELVKVKTGHTLLRYDFDTKYPKDSSSFYVNIPIRCDYSSRLERSTFHYFLPSSSYELEPIHVFFHGLYFKTGPMKIDDFKDLCAQIIKLPDVKDFHFSKFSCSNNSGLYIDLSCDANNQHCKIEDFYL